MHNGSARKLTGAAGQSGALQGQAAIFPRLAGQGGVAGT